MLDLRRCCSKPAGRFFDPRGGNAGTGAEACRPYRDRLENDSGRRARSPLRRSQSSQSERRVVSETKRRARASSRLARPHRTLREVHPRDLRCCRHLADGGKGQVWVAGHGLVTRGFANGCSAALRNTHSTTPSCRCYWRIKAIFGERRPRCHRATEGVNSAVERLTHRLGDDSRRAVTAVIPPISEPASVRCSARKQVASSAERPTATTTSTTFSASTQRSSHGQAVCKKIEGTRVASRSPTSAQRRMSAACRHRDSEP